MRNLTSTGLHALVEGTTMHDQEVVQTFGLAFHHASLQGFKFLQ